MGRIDFFALLSLVACRPTEVDDLEAGRLPQLLADPTVLDFGEVPVGDHRSLAVNVRNPASVEVVFQLGAGLIEQCGAEPALFCVERGPERIAPGALAEVWVRFSPTLPSPTGALLVVAACNDPRCSADIEVRGVGVRPRIQCEPRTLDFGGLVPGDCRSATLGCTNHGTTVGRLESATTSPEIYSTVDDFPRDLSPGDSVELTLEACPLAPGPTPGTLTIATDRLPIEVSLLAAGIDPELETTPGALDFGTVALSAPRSLSLVLKSVGTTPLEILGFELPSEGFWVDPSPPLVIIPGEERTISVTFEPLRPGAIDEVLSIRTNDRPNTTLVRMGGVAIDLPPCRAQARSPVVEVGPVEVGRLGRAFVVIDNTGVADCLFYDAHWASPARPELVLRPPELSRFGPGESLLLSIELTPTDLRSYSGLLLVDLSSGGPPLSVEITGRGVDNFLRVVPDPIDFGVVPASCAPQSRSVRILRQNVGDASDQVRAIQLEPLAGDAFSLEGLGNLPSSALAFDLEIHFDGVAERAVAELVIEATIDGVSGSHRIPVRAATAAAPTRVEHFSQLGSRRLDLLFVIETASGMTERRAALASGVPALLAQLGAEGIDYRIGVTTTDTGDFGGNEPRGRLLPTRGNAADRILGPGPSTEAKLRTNLTDQSFCTIDCYTGLEAMRLALSNPLRRTDNAGFLREDATLSLLYLANHDDASLRAVGDYLDLLRTTKATIDDHLITATAIVGDTPLGCPGSAAGDRYTAWAAALGGAAASICGIDAGTLAATSSILGFRSRYHLAQPAEGGGVEVRIDGVLVPSTFPGGAEAYRYDAASASVVFSPLALPEVGADVEVFYRVGCAP